MEKQHIDFMRAQLQSKPRCKTQEKRSRKTATDPGRSDAIEQKRARGATQGFDGATEQTRAFCGTAKKKSNEPENEHFADKSAKWASGRALRTTRMRAPAIHWGARLSRHVARPGGPIRGLKAKIPYIYGICILA
jgi:hypothetical protein